MPVVHLYQHGRYAISKLYDAPTQELSDYELAEMNLISAYGLPGTENMNFAELLGTINSWARQVAAYTLKHMRIFHDRREDFGSPARRANPDQVKAALNRTVR